MREIVRMTSHNFSHPGRIARYSAPNSRPPATKALHTMFCKNTSIVSRSWWWAYKCPKHAEQITSAINHSLASSWFSSLRIYLPNIYIIKYVIHLLLPPICATLSHSPLFNHLYGKITSFTDTDLSWLFNAGRGKSQFRKKEEIYLDQTLMYTDPFPPSRLILYLPFSKAVAKKTILM